MAESVAVPSSSVVTPIRLAKAVGILAIIASGVCQEYGSGINFVLVNSLGAYPTVAYLVPLAMLVAGIVLLPKVIMLMRFSAVMPRAGSTYVWLSRSLNLPVGFVVAFGWLVGECASTGFVAYAFGTFVGSTLSSAGVNASWVTTPVGHMMVGLIAIWLLFWLHYSGIRNYGTFMTIFLIVVVATALIVMAYGFSTTQQTFSAAATKVLGSTPPAPSGAASLAAFITVTTLFLQSYGGLTGSTSLGGEAKDATKAMPRGIFIAWLTAVVLFTLVALALFHAVPYWMVQPLVKAGHSDLATTPGLIGMIAPHAVAVLVNLLVMVIVGKTMAPAILDTSRYLFAWGEDKLLPSAFKHLSPNRTPDVALLVAGLLISLFLAEASFFTWTLGVALRAMTLVMVFGFIGIGVLNMRFNKSFESIPWAKQIAGYWYMPVVAILAIIIAIVMFSSVVVVPNAPFFLQPGAQVVVAIAIGVIIYYVAKGKARAQGVNIYESARAELPLD